MCVGPRCGFCDTMASTVRRGTGRLRLQGYMVKMRGCPRLVDVVCYCFGSSLEMNRSGGGHLGRHRITDPAAQGQQDDHEGED